MAVSQILLWWIPQTREEWKIWVQNRVETIQGNVVVEDWGFVPTSLNPTDICTRKCSVHKLKSCFAVVERTRIFVGRVPKNVDLEEKGNGEIGSSVNVSFSGNEVGIDVIVEGLVR